MDILVMQHGFSENALSEWRFVRAGEFERAAAIAKVWVDRLKKKIDTQVGEELTVHWFGPTGSPHMTSCVMVDKAGAVRWSLLWRPMSEFGDDPAEDIGK